MSLVSECLICCEPLAYLEKQEKMECAFCHQSFPSNTKCVKGHYVCDACHEKQGLELIKEFCLHTECKNPLEIAREIMRSPFIYMHGPEHHTLVGAALLAAYKNAGGKIELAQALDEMLNRAGRIPGGICGLYGCCGAAVSAGVFYSIITSTSPLSEESWGLCNSLTAKCLSHIGAIGGPRCCKRDSFTAILTAIDFVEKNTGVQIEKSPDVVCAFSHRNAQCIRAKCPYYASSTAAAGEIS